jgi:NAD(P)-dependent dehydrogenase (short-subunit alcohol dehydrogenase family)
MAREQADQIVRSSVSNIPLGRPGTTDATAEAVSLLASNDSSYVNGIQLFVDSRRMIQVPALGR